MTWPASTSDSEGIKTVEVKSGPNSTKKQHTSAAKDTKDTKVTKDDLKLLQNEDLSDEDYDEENDDDYDPSKFETKNAEESSDDDEIPDYSGVAGVSQVKTRGQIYSVSTAKSTISLSGLVQDELRIDIDAIFDSLETTDATEWCLLLRTDQEQNPKKQFQRGSSGQDLLVNDEEEQVKIVTTYTFAGRLVRESKLVAADSAEARAYLNSTSGLMNADEDQETHKSSVIVIRKIQGTDEERPLRIKLKRSSLIDKFLARDKKNKLTTLEKSRLDWASFVDKKKIKDDLAQHNKGGYLDKQAFLNRVDDKRDQNYQQAKDIERQRQWQQQQKLV